MMTGSFLDGAYCTTNDISERIANFLVGEPAL
jgi:hypothetical protein